MSLLESNNYVVPDVSGHEEAIKNRVESFVDSLVGETDEEKRINLPKIKNLLHGAVDAVMEDLPSGVDRVDGTIIKPVLDEVVNEKLSALPVEEGSE